MRGTRHRRGIRLGIRVAWVIAAALAFDSGSDLDSGSGENGGWQWPVTGARQVVRPFIAPTYQWSAGHRGVDVRAWDPVVRTPADGVVRFAGWVVDRPVLSIDHDGVISSYEPLVASVAAGDVVVAGQPIGTLLADHCEVLCLHLGVRVGGAYRNPLLWLGEVPRSVLLPTKTIG